MTEPHKTDHTIRVALLADEPLGWGSGKHFFPILLQGYSWTANHTRYHIQTTYLTDQEIRHGKLTTTDFDVVLVPGGGVGDGQALTKGSRVSPSVRRWRNQIARFVKEGGGYVGICGGSALMTKLQTQEKKPRTFVERQYNKSAIGVSCVSSYYKSFAMPLVYPFQHRRPEVIGAAGYVFSFAPGTTIEGDHMHTAGAPVDFRINSGHPVFQGAKPVELIRWWGGPGLLVPEKPDRDVHVLAWYPDRELSDDPSRHIYAWRYTGGLTGIIKAIGNALRLVKKNHAPLKKAFLYTFYLAGPWQRTNHIITLNQAKKPAITAEIYPNEHQGRILLCTAHPEYMRWTTGQIHERTDEQAVTIGSGFRAWNGVDPLKELMDAQVTATWWMVRRFVAWTAKLPDDALPPIEQTRLSDDQQRQLRPYLVWDGSQANQFLTI